MLHFLKMKRFRLGGTNKRAADSTDDSSLFEDVPRYPPFMKGLPVVGAQSLLNSQSELIGRIKNVLGYPKEQFESLVSPVLARYAAFVHLLPASETHHHRGAGGLFRHGLEVAFWAAQASEGQIFPMDTPKKFKAEHENRWRFSAFLAGLSHDLGKPISDMEISDKNGTTIWDPFQCSLLEWATTNNVDRYFVRWRNSRIHKQHENFSLLIFKEIVGHESLSYVSGFDKRTLPALFDAVGGTGGRTQPLTRLAMRADQESVKRDMANNRIEIDENSYGVPVHRYVFDAMRSLINEQTWAVNEAGAKVWMMDGSAFIVWKAAAKDIARKVQELNIPGVPRDADTLADVLIERGYALRNEVIADDGEVLHYRYWKIQPVDPQNTDGIAFELLALRLDDAERIFTGVVPGSVKGNIGTEKEIAQDKAQPKQDAVSPNSNATQGKCRIEVPEPKVNRDTSEENMTDTAGHTDLTLNSAAKTQNEQAKTGSEFMPPDLRGVIDRLKKNVIPVPPLEESSPDEAETLSVPSRKVAVPDTERYVDEKGFESVELGTIVDEQPSKEKGDSESEGEVRKGALQLAQEELTSLLANAGEASLLIDQLIQPIVCGEQWLGQCLMKQGHDMVILYPEGLRPLGEPFDIAQELAAAGLVVPDPVMQDRLVQVIDGVKVVVLKPAIAHALMNVFEAVRESEVILEKSSAAPASIATPHKGKNCRGNVQLEVQDEESKRSEHFDTIESQSIETSATSVVPDLEPCGRVEFVHESAESTIEEIPAWFDNLHKDGALAQRPIVAEPVPIQPLQKTEAEHHSQSVELQPVDIGSVDSTVPAQVLSGPADLGANPAVGKDAFVPKTITAKQAMQQLIEMMHLGEGRWIASGVRRHGDNLITSDVAFDRIVNDYPGIITRTQLRTQLRYFGGVCRSNEIHLKVSK